MQCPPKLLARVRMTEGGIRQLMHRRHPNGRGCDIVGQAGSTQSVHRRLVLYFLRTSCIFVLG